MRIYLWILRLTWSLILQLCNSAFFFLHTWASCAFVCTFSISIFHFFFEMKGFFFYILDALFTPLVCYFRPYAWDGFFSGLLVSICKGLMIPRFMTSNLEGPVGLKSVTSNGEEPMVLKVHDLQWRRTNGSRSVTSNGEELVVLRL